MAATNTEPGTFNPATGWRYTPGEKADQVLIDVREWLVACETENRALKRDVRNLCERNDDLQNGYNEKSDEASDLAKKLAAKDDEIAMLRSQLAEANRKLANADFLIRSGMSTLNGGAR